MYREGKINVKNYLKSSRTIRKIVKNYGPGILSSFQLYLTLFTLHSKETAYKIFSLANKHDYLVRTRNQPLTADEQQKVKQLIDTISAYNNI